MKIIFGFVLFFALCFLLLGMGDPTFLPSPRQPGLINEMQSTTSNLNQVHREPAEKKQIIEQEYKERPQEIEPLQQLMEPQPKSLPRIK